MIQINANITTPDGGVLVSGSVVDVTAHFKSEIIDLLDENDVVTATTVQHNCYFDANVYRSMLDYEGRIPRVKSVFNEFNVGYVQKNIDLVALNASPGMLDTVFGWLQTAIEEGGNGYTGVGAGNTAIVYPFQ